MAFPTTSVLDDFNRGNLGTLGSNWGPDPFNFGAANLGINSNQCEAAAAAYCGNYYNVANYGSDAEVYVKVVTKPGTGGDWALGARVVNPDTSGVDGYRLNIFTLAGTDEFRVQRVDNGVATQLGASITQEITNGDSAGMEIVGSTITVYYKSGAGSWGSLGTRSDATYSAAGRVSLESYNGGSGTPDYDDFGGGTVVAGGAAFSLDCQPGSFTVTGAAATVVSGRVVSADPGAYALTGASATTARGLFLNAESGSYALTGAVAGTLAARVVDAQPGSYAVTGSAAAVGRELALSADAGAYAVTGVAASLLSGRVMSADPGSYAVTGSVATLAAGLVFNAQPGTYAISGTDAGLDLETPGAYTLNAEPGVFALTGTAATAAATRLFDAQPGSYAITGASATVARQISIQADPGTYTLTGVAVTFVKTNVLAANPGTYTITGAEVDLALEGQAPNMDEHLTGWIAGATGSGRIRQPLTGSLA